MNEVLQTNIFFFITGIAVIIISAMVVVAFVYIIRILKDIKEISQVVRDEAHTIHDDVAHARTFVQEQGVKIKHFLQFVTMFFKRSDNAPSRKKTSKRPRIVVARNEPPSKESRENKSHII